MNLLDWAFAFCMLVIRGEASTNRIRGSDVPSAFVLRFYGVTSVINRGNYRDWIFETAGARKSFLECLDTCCLSQGWILHAWVLMLVSPAKGK